jgi:hypothetical protein
MAEYNPETVTSKPVMLSVLPEVSSIAGRFIYNFFTADERLNETNDSLYGSVAELGTTFAPSDLTDAELLKYYKKNSLYPRVNSISIEAPDNVKSVTLSRSEQDNLRNNLTFINASSAFKRVGLSIANTKIDRKISRTVSENASNMSSTDPDEPDIIKSLVTPMASGYVYVDPQFDAITSQLSTAFSGISFNTSLLPNVAKELINGSLASYKNIHAEELLSSITSISAAQDSAISINPYTIRISDFEEALPAIKTERIANPDPRRELNNVLVGFVVEKYSLSLDGTIKVYDTIIYTNPNYKTFTDVNVAYGRSYRYRIRCIYVCEFEVTLEKRDRTIGLFRVSVPFVSNGKDVVIDCVDQVAPPPPAGLRFRYQGEDRGLLITWEFPVDTQRDIKKFQVYRRRSISEPFRLLGVFDFDDSIIPTEDPDQIPERLITRSLLPVTLYRDRTFTKDSKFIYALVAVDAHGLSSNFSSQIEITYDKYSNRVTAKSISKSGAPRPYPNIYLNVDTFVDTMKLSGYKKLNIYFDPDYAKVQQRVINADGSSPPPIDLDHIVFTSGEGVDNEYKLLIVNTDMQKSQTLTIKIRDNYVEPNELSETTSRVFIASRTNRVMGTSTGPRSTSRATETTTGNTSSSMFPFGRSSRSS